VHEGKYVAKVEIGLVEDDPAWSPQSGLEDVYKLHDVKEALRHEHLELAAKYGGIYELRPVAHQ
jgi:hypothetical protein